MLFKYSIFFLFCQMKSYLLHFCLEQVSSDSFVLICFAEIDPLVMNLARAFRWQTLIDEGHFSNVNELANAIGKDSAYVARVLRLTLLAPEIVHSILTGNLPDNFSVDSLKQALPMLWSEQKKLLGIE